MKITKNIPGSNPIPGKLTKICDGILRANNTHALAAFYVVILVNCHLVN
jgi:hypothetical protein